MIGSSSSLVIGSKKGKKIKRGQNDNLESTTVKTHFCNLTSPQFTTTPMSYESLSFKILVKIFYKLQTKFCLKHRTHRHTLSLILSLL